MTNTNTASGAAEIAATICKSVAELPDRDSPADWPDAMLVTHDELSQIVIAALASAAAPAEQPSDLNLNCKSVQKRLATQWGFVPAMMYLELTDAMGYDSGEDGVTWSPEEWAAHLYAFYESHRDAPKPDTAYAAQEDAARYRWLREQSFDTWKLIAWNTWNNDPAVWPDRDAAIDAARKQGASHD